MSTLETPVASLPGVSVSLGQLLRGLHRQGRLWPLAAKALSARLVQQEARRAGLSATAEELQATADAFRRRAGLVTAADTHAWLARQGLSADDLEATPSDPLKQTWRDCSRKGGLSYGGRPGLPRRCPAGPAAPCNGARRLVFLLSPAAAGGRWSG
jgi:hypothetical protein